MRICGKFSRKKYVKLSYHVNRQKIVKKIDDRQIEHDDYYCNYLSNFDSIALLFSSFKSGI